MLGLDALKLDRDLLARDDVGSEIDVTEATTSNLSADTVLVAYAKILRVLVSMLRNESQALWCG